MTFGPSYQLNEVQEIVASEQAQVGAQARAA